MHLIYIGRAIGNDICHSVIHGITHPVAHGITHSVIHSVGHSVIMSIALDTNTMIHRVLRILLNQIILLLVAVDKIILIHHVHWIPTRWNMGQSRGNRHILRHSR